MRRGLWRAYTLGIFLPSSCNTSWQLISCLRDLIKKKKKNLRGIHCLFCNTFGMEFDPERQEDLETRMTSFFFSWNRRYVITKHVVTRRCLFFPPVRSMNPYGALDFAFFFPEHFLVFDPRPRVSSPAIRCGHGGVSRVHHGARVSIDPGRMLWAFKIREIWQVIAVRRSADPPTHSQAGQQWGQNHTHTTMQDFALLLAVLLLLLLLLYRV